MDSPLSPAILLLFIVSSSSSFFLFVSSSPNSSSLELHAISNGESKEREEGSRIIGRRYLMSFKETPSGSTNITYDCFPSGPCVPCSYSEKKDEKYRCSETGYRIRFKCVEIKASSKEVKNNHGKNRSALEDTYTAVRPHVMSHNEQALTSSVRQRNLLDGSSTSKDGMHTYITYRSCVLSVNEEKLSVLGFEVIMLGLLIVSGSAIYFRKRRAGAVPGAGPVRLPTNSRF